MASPLDSIFGSSAKASTTSNASPLANVFGTTKTSAPVVAPAPTTQSPVPSSSVAPTAPIKSTGDPLADAMATAVANGKISGADATPLLNKANGVPMSVSLLPDTMGSLADLQTNPGSFGHSFSDIINTPQTDVNTAAKNFGTALQGFKGELSSDDPISKKVGDTLNTLVSGAQFALSPITSFFDAASKVPVIGTIAKLTFLPLLFTGDVTGDAGAEVVNALPISQQAKDNLIPGVKATFKLAGQILLGGAVTPDIIGTLKDQFGAKDANTIITQAQQVAYDKANMPKSTLSDIATAPEPSAPEVDEKGKLPAPSDEEIDATAKQTGSEEPIKDNRTPIQNSKTVDLNKPASDLDIKTPDMRTPMDALADKMNKGKPVTDVIAPKTPVTVKGSDAQFKVTSDTGAKTTKVVDLATGNEEEVPRDSVSKVKSPSEEITQSIKKKILYHGTDDVSADNIRKNGFQPTRTEISPNTYQTTQPHFADNIKDAQTFANARAEQTGGKSVVLSVDATDANAKPGLDGKDYTVDNLDKLKLDEITKPKTRSVNVLKPIEGTGETKTAGLSKSVETQAITSGLVDQMGDLPEYKKIDMADQAKKVAKLMEEDPERAKRIAMGDENAPKGIIPEAVHTAMRIQAQADGDGEMAKDLANSKLTGQATTMGQRIQALKGANDEDPTQAIKDLQKAREEAHNEKAKVDVKKASDAIEKAKADRVSGKTKVDWGSFIESLKC